MRSEIYWNCYNYYFGLSSRSFLQNLLKYVSASTDNVFRGQWATEETPPLTQFRPKRLVHDFAEITTAHQLKIIMFAMKTAMKASNVWRLCMLIRNCNFKKIVCLIVHTKEKIKSVQFRSDKILKKLKPIL